MPAILSLFSKTHSKTQKYAAHGSLVGHSGSVVCIGATEDGRLLASGGTDGARVWNLETMSPIPRPGGAGSRGATTCILWVRREVEAAEILFYGTQNGHMVCWKQTSPSIFEELYVNQLTDAAEITGLAFDAASNRLIVCHRNSVVQAYTIERSMMPRAVFSVKIDNFVPKAIAFGNFKNNEKEIMVFGLYDGQIHTLRGGTGEIIRTMQVGGMIGDAEVHAKKGLFCIDDPLQGAALYRLDDDNRMRTFEVKMTKSHPRPRQVCFADDGGFIVSGSDHGIVYIFDRWTGEVVDELSVGRGDWIQTVAATDVNGIPTILAARSRELSGPNDILLWKRARTRRRLSLPSFCGHLMTCLHVLLVVGIMAYLYQNMSGRVSAL